MYRGLGYSGAHSSYFSRGKNECKATVRFVQASMREPIRNKATASAARLRPKKKSLGSVQPLYVADLTLFRRIIKSLHTLRIKRAKCSIVKLPESAYFVAKFVIHTVPYSVRINIDRAYRLKKSIGGVRAFIRSRVAASLGHFRANFPIKRRERKVVPTPAMVSQRILARIARRSAMSAAISQQVHEHCKCYMIYFPECWPNTVPNPNGLTDEEYGAVLRVGTPLQFAQDKQYYPAALQKWPEVGDPYLGTSGAKSYRMSHMVKVQKLPYFSTRRDLAGVNTVVDHNEHITFSRDMPLSLQVGDWQLEIFDDAWEDE